MTQKGTRLMKVEWLIIGGGIHGVHIAAKLLSEDLVEPQQLRIVDPHQELLASWQTRTSRTGMLYLRSPSVHHIGLDPWSLLRFAGKKKKQRAKFFTSPYDRPSLDLFNNHCRNIIEEFSLTDLHIKSRVNDCLVDLNTIKVRLTNEQEVIAQNIVLAIGASEQPQWLDWAPKDHPKVQHIFDPRFDSWPSETETVAVIGGGISACQVALRLAKEKHQVHLLTRHELREHQFDSEPGWLGPKYMTAFKRERDLKQRRSKISQARHKGSVPSDVKIALRRAFKNGSVQWYQDQVKAIDYENLKYELKTDLGSKIKVDRILLATGFTTTRPGGEMIDRLVESAALPCASCGYPVVDDSLRWQKNIYVSGPLAELEIGPVSRNIAGARRSAERIVKGLKHQEEKIKQIS